jgi:glycosyltransferase involved in cell wall biosynthesis
MVKYPKISIIIVTLNAKRTLSECLKYISQQTYPAIDEVLLIDGGTTDKSLDVIKKFTLPIKIINGGYRENQEARRAIGIEKSRNEICFLIDSDNYITQKTWLVNMVTPLLENKEIVATQTLRYATPKNSTSFNRYFGLLGAADPAAYYLGKSDRLSWAFDNWNLLGNIIKDNKNYFVIQFDKDNFPTFGCNGIGLRKSILLKSNWGKPENYFHTDVFVDIARKGYNTFAIVKNEVFHNTADNIWTFFGKRRRYMKLHHQSLHSKRRYLVFNPKHFSDVFRLTLFVVYAFTLVEPIFESIRGYMKKKDPAWFLHPIICIGMALVYFEATIYKTFTLKK